MEIVFLIIIILLVIIFGVTILFLNQYFKHRLKKEIVRAQKSERLKAVFLDNTSHTLRTPLNAIMGYSNLILEENDKNLQPAQVKEMTAHIKNNCQQLLDYVEHIMELSSYEGGLLSFTNIEVNLAELMASYRREALKLTKPEVSIRVRTALSPHCKATLDTNFMHQLMMHLLTNAAKHALEGDITIDYSNERRGLKVTISYIGNGKAEIINEDIFSFLQRESAMTMANATTDLGLPICKAIIDAIGSELDMDVVNGQKTVTTMWFPCRMRDKNKGI